MRRDYRVGLMIDAESKAEVSSRRWRFALSTQDEQNLRLNVVTLVRALCNPRVVYNFACKDYVTG